MNLAIIGAGEMAKELYSLIISEDNKYEKIFFVDLKANKSKNIISEKDFFADLINDSEILIAAGEPSLRQKLYDKYKKKNAKFARFIHKSAVISNESTFGEGCIILPFVYVSNNVKIEPNVLLHSGVKIENNCILEENSFFSCNAFIGAKTIVCKNCFIGPNVTVRDSLNIGNNSIIGMGSVVTKSVEKNSVCFGSPAVKIRNNTGKVFK